MQALVGQGDQSSLLSLPIIAFSSPWGGWINGLSSGFVSFFRIVVIPKWKDQCMETFWLQEHNWQVEKKYWRGQAKQGDQEEQDTALCPGTLQQSQLWPEISFNRGNLIFKCLSLLHCWIITCTDQCEAWPSWCETALPLQVDLYLRKLNTRLRCKRVFTKICTSNCIYEVKWEPLYMEESSVRWGWEGWHKFAWIECNRASYVDWGLAAGVSFLTCTNWKCPTQMSVHVAPASRHQSTSSHCVQHMWPHSNVTCGPKQWTTGRTCRDWWWCPSGWLWTFTLRTNHDNLAWPLESRSRKNKIKIMSF